MDEIHISQTPDPSPDVDEVIRMTFVKNTLGIFRDRGLTPAQSIFKLLGPLPHQPLENVSWTAAECILFLEIQRICELRGTHGNPFLELPEGH